jgi:hypothetical protein
MPHSRVEARATGKKHYWTGMPCSKGHLTFRHLTGTCVECQKAANQGWRSRNPGESKRRAAEWQRKNPERARARHQRWRHKKEGIPVATRPAPRACENCCRVFKSGHDCHLDHDHKTGKFRGWLCNRCNRGLGYFDDCIEGLQQAIRYLQRAG